MALINCTECNKEISDKAKRCPNCGCPIKIKKVKDRKKSKLTKIVIICGVVMVALVGGGIVLFHLVISPKMTYERAETFFRNQEYEQAIQELNTIPEYEYTDGLLEEIEKAKQSEIYNDVQTMVNEEKWADANRLLESIPDYPDSLLLKEKIVLQMTYEEVELLYERASYEEALEKLKTIPGHEMYAELEAKIIEGQQEDKFENAVALLKEGKCADAVAMLKGVPSSSEVSKLKKQARFESYAYACINELMKILKSPETLYIRDLAFYSDISKPACVIEYSAQNGFGGVSIEYAYIRYEPRTKNYRCCGSVDSLNQDDYNILLSSEADKWIVCGYINDAKAKKEMGDFDLERINSVIKGKRNITVNIVE